MSSATSARCGSSSRQLHAALRRACANFHGLAEHLGAGLRRVVVLDVAGERLAVELGRARLGVEQVEVARPALHEQRDHRLRPGRACGGLGLQVEARPLQVRLAPASAGEQAVLVEQPGQGERADAHALARQEVPPRWRGCAGVVRVGPWPIAPIVSPPAGQSTYRNGSSRAAPGRTPARARRSAGAGGGLLAGLFGAPGRPPAKSARCASRNARAAATLRRRPARPPKASRQARRDLSRRVVARLAADPRRRRRPPARPRTSLFISISACGATVEARPPLAVRLSGRPRRTPPARQRAATAGPGRRRCGGTPRRRATSACRSGRPAPSRFVHADDDLARRRPPPPGPAGRTSSGSACR